MIYGKSLAFFRYSASIKIVLSILISTYVVQRAISVFVFTQECGFKVSYDCFLLEEKVSSPLSLKHPNFK